MGRINAEARADFQLREGRQESTLDSWGNGNMRFVGLKQALGFGGGELVRDWGKPLGSLRSPVGHLDFILRATWSH